MDSLRHHAEALLEVRTGLASAIRRTDNPTDKEKLWRCLERLDELLKGLLPDLDEEWMVTEYIESLDTVENIPYSPAEWTDPGPPSDPPERRS